MITINVDHSHEDDYFCISSIDVDIKDENEAKRIDEILDKNDRFEGQLLTIGDDFMSGLSELLQVSKAIITIDTEEIDIS